MAFKKIGQLLFVFTAFLLAFFNSRIINWSQDTEGLLVHGHPQRKVQMFIFDVTTNRPRATKMEEPEIRETGEGKEGVSLVSPSPSTPMYVLILTSLPRSGSTFLSELLANIKDSVLFFEPLWINQETPCMKDGRCTERFIMDTFACEQTAEFEQWLKSMEFLKYFNPVASTCLGKDANSRKSCVEQLNLRQMCLESPVRLIKVIRARIHWFERVLVNTTINLKLIHLTRDPRGSMNSIRKFGWDNDPFERCSDLDDDMNTFNLYSDRYPTKVLQVSHENLCLHSLEETTKIFQFLYGTSSLPMAIRNHLKSHTTEKNELVGSMNTRKDSKKKFEGWRWEIPDSLLKRIEEEPTCLRSIHRMNHRVFGATEWVRNSSISLIIT